MRGPLPRLLVLILLVLAVEVWLVGVLGLELRKTALVTSGVAAAGVVWKLVGRAWARRDRRQVEDLLKGLLSLATRWPFLITAWATFVVASLLVSRVRIETVYLAATSAVKVTSSSGREVTSVAVVEAGKALDLRSLVWPWGRSLRVRAPLCPDVSVTAVPWRVRTASPCGSPSLLFRVPAALLAVLGQGSRLEVRIDGAPFRVELGAEIGAVIIGAARDWPSGWTDRWDDELTASGLGEVDQARARLCWRQAARFPAVLAAGQTAVATLVADEVERATVTAVVGEQPFVDLRLEPLP